MARYVRGWGATWRRFLGQGSDKGLVPRVKVPAAASAGGSAAAAAEDVEWFEVVFKKVLVKKEPDKNAKSWGWLVQGQKIQARAARASDAAGREWAELTLFELWRSCKCRSQNDHGYALIDGTDLGLALLLRGPLKETEWPGPDLAEAAGLQWFGVPAALPPPSPMLEEGYICRWNPDARGLTLPGAAHCDGRCSVGEFEPLGHPAFGASPRLCVGTMLRGAPPECVRSWILYHFKVGFERLYLFFDDPADPAIEVADLFTRPDDDSGRGVQSVELHRMTAGWWRWAQDKSRFYDNRFDWGRSVVEQHEQIHDVTARQQLCIDLAAQDATERGLNWILHVDIDELLYFPQAAHRTDAPAWFSGLPLHVEMVRFHNHECAPESLEVEDWFRDVTIFKVNADFLKPWEELQGEWRDESPQPASNDDDNDADKDAEKKKKQKDRATGRFRLPSRSRTKKSDGGDAEDQDSKDDSETQKKGVRLSRRTQPVLTTEPSPWRQFEEAIQEIYNARLWRTSQLNLRLPSEADWVRSGRKKEGKQPLKPSYPVQETFVHFLGYGDGKAAARLQQSRPAPCPAFVTRFVGINRQWGTRSLVRRRADGDMDPVVLHYCNCGFSSWRLKYELLGDFPDAVSGTFNQMRAHLAARDVVKAGDTGNMELFYRLFVMGNEFGELPSMICRGLAVRIYGAQQVVKDARREYETRGGLRPRTTH